MVLVLLTGLPGTGKSTIAAAVARVLPAIVISADPIDDALRTAAVDNPHGKTGYELMKALAATQLDAGLHVVIDAVNPFAWVRHEYAAIADAHGAPLRVIVTTCSDEALHRRRVDDRFAAGRKRLDWSGVEHQVAYYEPYEGEGLRLDAADGVEANVAAATAFVLA